MITILACFERISLYHTMIPFFLKNRLLKKTGKKKAFTITQSAAWCIHNDKNSVLFMERCFQHREPRDLEPAELETIKRLRDRYKTIVFFCGQPEAGTNRLDLLPYVDRLFYKSVFADRGNYRKNLYGKNLFADYYHRNFGIKDSPEYINSGIISEENALRPELSWNLGVGTYPRYHWPQRVGTILARANMSGIGRNIGGKPLRRAEELGTKPENFSGEKRNIAVHARIDPVSCPSIAFQRCHFLDCIAEITKNNPLKGGLFLTGMAPQNQYYHELKDSKIVLSPFGWGEVCFRDFEAILAGAMLLKPDMSHLISWPNIYIPYETYVPLAWDGSDLLEQTERYLADEKERKRIAFNAFEQYRTELAGLSRRFDALLGEYF